MSKTITVGTLAKRAGVNLQTVLYYERRGLLLPVRRSESGYRLYGEEGLKALRFIKNAQGLGFSLEEIRRLLRLRVRKSSQCAAVKKSAEARLAIVQEKIAELKKIERSLKRVRSTCSRQAVTGPCPILEGLE